MSVKYTKAKAITLVEACREKGYTLTVEKENESLVLRIQHRHWENKTGRVCPTRWSDEYSEHEVLTDKTAYEFIRAVTGMRLVTRWECS